MMKSSILVALVAIAVLLGAQCTSATIAGAPAAVDAGQVDYDALAAKIEMLRPQRYWKRAHNIDTRALNQFKNCYFSPIQCVLMERRRK